MDLATFIAQWSKDRSTKVGAVVVGEGHEVISTGYNGFPPGFDDECDAYHERPTKLLYTTHAEANAIVQAAKNGHSMNGTTIYSTLHPCADCAKLIIGAGIKRVVTPPINPKMSLWKDSFDASQRMFGVCGVAVINPFQD
jgi:dCMP deaminase